MIGHFSDQLSVISTSAIRRLEIRNFIFFIPLKGEALDHDFSVKKSNSSLFQTAISSILLFFSKFTLSSLLPTPYSLLPTQIKMTSKYSDKIITEISTIFSEKQSKYNHKTQTKLNNIQEPITTAPPEVKKIIGRVLQLEKDRLYKKTPRINDDILKIIKEAVQ